MWMWGECDVNVMWCVFVLFVCYLCNYCVLLACCSCNTCVFICYLDVVVCLPLFLRAFVYCCPMLKHAAFQVCFHHPPILMLSHTSQPFPHIIQFPTFLFIRPWASPQSRTSSTPTTCTWTGARWESQAFVVLQRRCVCSWPSVFAFCIFSGFSELILRACAHLSHCLNRSSIHTAITVHRLN